MRPVKAHLIQYRVRYCSGSLVGALDHFLETVLGAGPAAAEACRVPWIAKRYSPALAPLVLAPDAKDAISFKGNHHRLHCVSL
jgi:hypothetical protein